MSGAASAALVDRCAQARIRLEARAARWDVVLDGAATRNAQTPATWRALGAVGEAVAGPGGPRVVVLRAQGPSFSAGLDRAMLTSGVPGEPSLSDLAGLDDDTLDAVIAGFQRAFTWWRDVDAVTVAAVQGHAVGAGFQLALACDLRILTSDATFTMAETSLGLVPDLAGTGPLVAAVGYARALEICVTGRRVHADEALRLGLAQQVVDPADLRAAVDAAVEGLCRSPAGAVTAIKHLLSAADGVEAAAQRARERTAQIGRLRALAEASGAPAR